MLLKTFMKEYTNNANRGDPPKIVGQGIVALNREVQQQIDLEKRQISTPDQKASPGLKR